MTLVSPGVQVTVIDQSQYVSAPTNSIPFILLATAQNKAQPNSTAVATGTTAANAGQLYLITSQQDLVNTYGNPFFYNTTNGTPINGYELNEYGLLAAYSALGVTNQVYCLRADIDLASLVGSTGRPLGNPANGTYWLDTTNSTWGIYEFNSTTGQFALQTPLVLTLASQLSGTAPSPSIGSIGQYAVVAVPNYNYPSASNAPMFFKKVPGNTWAPVGSYSWLGSLPTVMGAAPAPNPTLNPGDNLTITINGGAQLTITVPASPNNNISNISSQINAAGLTPLSAAVVGGNLQIYSKQTNANFANLAVPFSLGIAGTSTLLSALGITTGTYYQPQTTYGTSAQQPLWQSGQTYPAPSGSVWFKVGSAGNGLNTVIKQWNSTTATWVPQLVSYATDDWNATAALDSTGGLAIPAGTVYTQYWYDQDVRTGWVNSPLYYWERIATGPTIITGNNNAPSFGNTTTVNAGSFVTGTLYTIKTVGTTDFTLIGAANNNIGTQFTASGPGTGSGTATITTLYSANVFVSVPGSNSLSAAYTFGGTNGTALVTGADFVAAWQAANIPYTSAALTATGSIQLTHTAGGTIVVNDVSPTTGLSNGLMMDAGFVIGTTQGVKEGPFGVASFTPTASSGGSGSGLQLKVTNYYQTYYVNPTSFVSGGSGYAVGNSITFNGTQFGGTSPANDLIVTVEAVSAGVVTAVSFKSGVGPIAYSTQLSNWQEFTMQASSGAPFNAPASGTNWFYSVVDQVDIMVNTSTGWKGYNNVCFNSNGFPLPTGTPVTDPNGPLVSATMPTTQSDGTALQYGDLWIDTANLTEYPVIYRWQLAGNPQTAQWVMINTADHVDSSGIIFQDARWGTSGSVSPVTDAIPTIQSLLTSNYLDLDAPNHSLYPVGMLLYNTRRSGYNVKQYIANYFNNSTFPGATLPAVTDAWVTVSGNMEDGTPYMGSNAQRAMVVKAMRATIDTNTAIRDEDNFFNLIAAPNYPELQPNMIVLNDDRGQTGYIVGDTPMNLPATGTAIQAWANNSYGSVTTDMNGLVNRDTYLGLFYPSGTTSDLNGNIVAVPPSHMMIRTFLRNDNIAYPWFAAAGTRRGIIDNATSLGYIDSATGSFITVKTSQGIRDTLYENEINPLVFFSGNGLLCYGNITSYKSSSALDRINVARLIAYLRRQLTLAARPFVFEPNDSLTRSQITGVIQSLLVDLVAKRGVYDYLVVCDLSNNTPARIDRNELWVDVAIEPVKAVEFIYIPVRVLATGTLGNNKGQ